MFDKQELMGTKLSQLEKTLPTKKYDARVAQALKDGLTAADSIEDKTISCFARTDLPHYAGLNTFMKLPYLEDVNKVGDYDVAIMGVPYDGASYYRPGTRFGPQGVRRASVAYSTYQFDFGVDLFESLEMVDIGDIFAIPSNNEKTFDQITKAVSHVKGKGVFPMAIGGDHSVSFPLIRGVAEHVDGKMGIIHFDCHPDMQDIDLDERMHTTPFFHATNLPNVSPDNMVQLGIHGPQAGRGPTRGSASKNLAIMTVDEIIDMGIDKAAEIALEIAWKGTKGVYLSFDIDCMDSAYIPGTCSPDVGGFLPREALKLIRLFAKEGLCGMDVVEVAPCYDISDITSMMACRAMIDALAAMVANGKLG